MNGSILSNKSFWAGVFFAVVAVATPFMRVTAYDALTPLSGRVVGTWKTWSQHGWVLDTDQGPERVRVDKGVWGGETELRSAAILRGDDVAARVGRDFRGRPDGDMWEIVVNGDTVLTYPERRALAEREHRRRGLVSAAVAVLLVGTALARRRSRREEPPALRRRSD